MSDLSVKQMYDLLMQANDKQTKDLKAEIKTSECNVTKQLKRTNKKLQKIESRCLFLERKARKNNIIIFDITIENKLNIVQETIQKLNDLLDLNIVTTDLNNVYTIGRTSMPPVIVEFISYLKKSEIFKNIDKLRNLKSTNISIANDLCEKDRNDKKILRRHLKLAKEKNKVAQIKGLRLEIDDKLYSASDLENWETDLETSSSEQNTSDEESDLEIVDQPLSQNLVRGKSKESGEKLHEEKGKRKRNKQTTPSPQHARMTRGTKKKRN